MSTFNYPLYFQFKIGTIANDFIAKDASGQTICYVREKIFAWRDQIKIYSDESKTNLLYELVSDKLIDFQQTFTIKDHSGRIVGKVRRKTLRSLWRSTFRLMNSEDNHDHTIQEKNPWTKFMDGLFGEIPLIGILSGYFFNPAYLLSNSDGQVLFEIKKESSFFGRKFTVHKLTSDNVDEERFVLSLMLMVLIERSNG